LLRAGTANATPTRTRNLPLCDVYAAAYATELVFGKVVAGLQSPFNVSAMRGLVERCLDGLTENDGHEIDGPSVQA